MPDEEALTDMPVSVEDANVVTDNVEVGKKFVAEEVVPEVVEDDVDDALVHDPVEDDESDDPPEAVGKVVTNPEPVIVDTDIEMEEAADELVLEYDVNEEDDCILRGDGVPIGNGRVTFELGVDELEAVEIEGVIPSEDPLPGQEVIGVAE